jgi:hypothetical protein
MSFLEFLESLSFSTWVRESSSIWAFPTFLVAHTIGMSIVAGGSVMMSLAILGFWPKMSIRPMEKMYPLMWFGFGINAVTGVSLLVADATTRLTSWDFYLKMVFVFLGTWLLSKTRKLVFTGPELDGGAVPAGARGLAVASMICWFGAIVAGRLLAYVGSVAGIAGGR